MTRDEREEEQEFLADLHARTGRSLADWMAAITAQGYADKNETIDWLRRQGFPFARASWLERIHSNGGRPIYEHTRRVSPTPSRRPPRQACCPQGGRAKALSTDEAGLYEKLLAAAKGYRPLYLMLESELRKAFPSLLILPKASYLSIGAPKEFAAVTLHATEVRLGLDLGDRAFDPHVQKAKMKGPVLPSLTWLPDGRAAGGWRPAGPAGSSQRAGKCLEQDRFGLDNFASIATWRPTRESGSVPDL
jgi:hypothetical protein